MSRQRLTTRVHLTGDLAVVDRTGTGEQIETWTFEHAPQALAEEARSRPGGWLLLAMTIWPWLIGAATAVIAGPAFGFLALAVATAATYVTARRHTATGHDMASEQAQSRRR